jgi:hypothetical protein
MKQVLEAARAFQEFCEKNRWEFCFIGGIALQRWAIPRNTNDVDITLLTGIGPEEAVTKLLLQHFDSRIKDDPLGFFLPRRILLLSYKNVGIDISLGALDFERDAVNRSTYADLLPDIRLRTCSAEDLVVFKSFANRTKDWADVESIISLQSTLDWKYIDRALAPLVELKEEPEIQVRLARARDLFGKQ